MSDKKNFSFRQDIEGLRGIAVLLVLIFHAFPKFLPSGYIGVDIFFVISGFLIGTITIDEKKTGRFSFLNFLKKRVNRLFPALALVLLTTSFFSYLILLPSDLKLYGKHLLSAGLNFINMVLSLEAGYFDQKSDYKPLLHLWSLAVEEQFYLLWALILSFISLAKLKRITSLLFILSFSMYTYLIFKNQIYAFYWLPARCWQIVAGILLGYCTLQNSVPTKKVTAFKVVLFLLLIGISLAKGIKPLLASILPVFITLVFLSQKDSPFNLKFLTLKALTFFGKISYSLYLWHWPILVFVRYKYGVELSFFVALVCVIISIALAVLTTHFESFYKMAKLNFKTPITVGVYFVFTFLVGAIFYLNNGFTNRYPQEITAIFEAGSLYSYYNYDKQIRNGVCHNLEKSDYKKNFDNECLKNNKREYVVLIGDSYAATHATSLGDYFKNSKLHLIQFTTFNAPPFFRKDVTLETGVSHFEHTMEGVNLIEKFQPKVVYISWMINGKNSLPLKESLNHFSNYIHMIKSKSPHTSIVHIGPTPHWKKSPQISYVNFYIRNRELLPFRSSFELEEEPFYWDKNFKSFAREEKISYISLIDIFCMNRSCLNRDGNSLDDFYFIDWGHLNQKGANFVLPGLTNVF